MKKITEEETENKVENDDPRGAIECKKELGEMCEKIRNKAGIGRDKLLDIIGYDSKQVKRVEGGKVFPTNDYLSRLSLEFYNIAAEEFAFGKKYNSNYDSFKEIKDLDTYEQLIVLLNVEREKYGLSYNSISELKNIIEENVYTIENDVKFMKALIIFEWDKRKLNTSFIARMLRYSNKTINNMRSNKNGKTNNVTMEILFKVCREWKIPLQYFLSYNMKNYTIAVEYLMDDLENTDENNKVFLMEYLKIYKEKFLREKNMKNK